MTDEFDQWQSTGPGEEDDPGGYTDPALEGLREVAGTIGVRDTRAIGDYAAMLADMGRASHSPFGDRLVILAGRLLDFSREARRRLAEDRLPDDAGTAEQQQRRRDAAADNLGGEPAS